MTRSRKGGFWLSALCLIALMTGFAGIGYGIGRYVIGERYIKRGAVAIRYRQRPQPEARRGRMNDGRFQELTARCHDGSPR